MTGQKGTARTRLGQPQPLTAHRDPPVLTTRIYGNGGRLELWSPSDVRAVPCPASRWTSRPDRLPEHRMPGGRIWADTVTSNRHAIAEPEGGRGQATDHRHEHSDILDNHNTKTAHRTPDPVGPTLAAGQPMTARRWRHCQRDRSHRRDQAAAWCRRTALQAAPRRTALLGRFRVERRANGDASSVMASVDVVDAMAGKQPGSKNGRRCGFKRCHYL